MAASLAAPEPDVRHSRIRLYPKPMIRPPGADGTPGLIPDYLVATRSSLGYLHDAQIASSPIVGMFPKPLPIATFPGCAHVQERDPWTPWGRLP